MFNEAYFDMTIDYMEPVFKNDSKFINVDKLKVKRVNKTHYMIFGETTLFTDFTVDNDYYFQINLYNKAGNDYKLMPYKFQPRPSCEFYDKDNIFTPNVVETTDLPKKVR